jgi:hypothetical protein
VADIAICVGVALMAIDMLTSRRGKKAPLTADVPVIPPEPTEPGMLAEAPLLVGEADEPALAAEAAAATATTATSTETESKTAEPT